MARVSKRGCALRAAGRQGETQCEVRRYRAGIYARLSSGQGAKDPSGAGRAFACESIEVQIAIAKKYAEEWNRRQTGEVIDVVACYTDLG